MEFWIKIYKIMNLNKLININLFKLVFFGYLVIEKKKLINIEMFLSKWKYL